MATWLVIPKQPLISHLIRETSETLFSEKRGCQGARTLRYHLYVYSWNMHRIIHVQYSLSQHLCEDGIIMPIWQKANSSSSQWKIHLPESSRQEQEWDCTSYSPQRENKVLLDRWQTSRTWKLAVLHISSIVPMWEHHSPTLLFEEARGKDEIPVHGPGGDNGSGVRVKGLWFLPLPYLDSLFIWELNGKLFFQYWSRS